MPFFADRPQTRRRFLLRSTAAGGGLIAVLLSIPAIGFLLQPIWARARTSDWIRVGALDDVPFDTPTAKVVVVPTGEAWDTGQSGGPQISPQRVVYVVTSRDASFGTQWQKGGQTVSYRALSNICSHMQCDVHWEAAAGGASGRFLCPCHGGLYDMSGRNIGGPPPSPLPEWESQTRQESGQTILYIRNRFNYQI